MIRPILDRTAGAGGFSWGCGLCGTFSENSTLHQSAARLILAQLEQNVRHNPKDFATCKLQHSLGSVPAFL
jgi:hypothetical protein